MKVDEKIEDPKGSLERLKTGIRLALSVSKRELERRQKAWAKVRRARKDG